jgi:large subunit ribosomal protein L9
MKVVLLKDVPKLGRKHEVKEVADGFAYNSLIPRGLVAPATKEAVSRAVAHDEATKEAIAAREATVRTISKETAADPVIIVGEANAAGHLYKGVRAEDVHGALSAHGWELSIKDVLLRTPLKEVGPHIIPILSGSVRGEAHIIIKTK